MIRCVCGLEFLTQKELLEHRKQNPIKSFSDMLHREVKGISICDIEMISMKLTRKCPNCGKTVTSEQAKAMVSVVKMLEQNKVRTPYRGAMKCHECGCQISFSLK